MADVFISYASEDVALAEVLASNLEREGFDVWWDRHIIPVGDLNSIIEKELKECGAAVVIWSAASVNSDWVKGEAATARAANKLICTIAEDSVANSMPINFRSLPAVLVEDVSRISRALQALNVRPSQYDPRLRSILEQAARRDLFSYDFCLAPNDTNLWDDPMNFSRLAVRVALRDFEFPLELEAESHTDGLGDLGIDGIAVAWGDQLVDEPERAADLVRTNPNGPLRLLFVQAKLSKEVRQRDVSYFGQQIQQFLRLPEDRLLRTRPNDAVLRHWTRFDALRTALQELNLDLRPEVSIAFIYGGPWRHFTGPDNAREVVLENLRAQLFDARVTMDIWGAAEFLAACDRAIPASEIMLHGAQLMRAPAGDVEAYLGFVPASNLLDALSHRSRTGAETLNPQFFTLNPRSFLRLDGRAINPGAKALRESLREGRAREVILGHNGVVITAIKAEMPDKDVIRLLSPQVINGGQSTFTFLETRDLLADVYVPLKVVVTTDPGITERTIRAANTQTPVDDYDMLSRMPTVVQLQRPFESGSPGERLWLKRRRGEWLIDFRNDWNRVLTPRQLMEAFVAVSLDTPHAVGHALKMAMDGRIFASDHEPTMYRALGWLVACGRAWCEPSTNKRWDDQYYGGGKRIFAGRHHYCFTLFSLADVEGGIKDERELLRGPEALNRFQNCVNVLAREYDAFRANPQASLLTRAGEIMISVAGGSDEITSQRASTAEYTNAIRGRVAAIKGRQRSGA